MSQLERWLHDKPERTSPLVKAALGILAQPLLYLSLYLKERRDEYYDLLTRVRSNGDWEAWLTFFVTGLEDGEPLPP